MTNTIYVILFWLNKDYMIEKAPEHDPEIKIKAQLSRKCRVKRARKVSEEFSKLVVDGYFCWFFLKILFLGFFPELAVTHVKD